MQSDKDKEGAKKASRFEKLMGSTTFNEDDFSELLTAFSIINKDHNGQISASELGNMMKSVGHYATQDELEDMMNEGATRESEREKPDSLKEEDFLDFPEFVSLIVRGLKAEFADPKELDGKISKAFDMFQSEDEKEKGFITVDSLMKCLQNLDEAQSKEYIEKLLKESCMSGDGKLSLDGKSPFPSSNNFSFNRQINKLLSLFKSSKR